MRIPTFLLLACFVMLLLGIISASGPKDDNSRDTPSSKNNLSQLTCSEALPFVQFPVTLFDETKIKNPNKFPTKEQLKTIGKLAEGIKKIALQKGAGRWWVCGDTLPKEEVDDFAIEWAFRIVQLSHKYSDERATINPWGIAGTAANESGFDPCALGKWPRKWGYEHGTMKPRKLTLSPKYTEIKRTLSHPKGVSRWETIGLDAAPLHILWNCNHKKMCNLKYPRGLDLPDLTYEEVFSLGKGFEYCVLTLRQNAINYSSETPWAYWPGHYSRVYLRKIERWAKRMGATPQDI